MAVFSMILSLLSGVALFLFGMSLMGDGLKLVAGNKLEAFLYRMTNTPLKGVALGTCVTSVIQSSSATTVMVIGFVNSGMMKLKQAIGIIMGANIGTSITGWILCLSYIQGSGGIASILSTATISAVVAVIGIILRMFCKRSVHKNIGNIMLGFAILMTGMQNGKRTALIYLMNDLFGLILWSIIFYTANAIVHFGFMDMIMTPVTIAALNTVFRVATVVVLFPFIPKLEKLVCMLVKNSAEELEDEADFDLLEERLINYPALAIAQCHRAMNGMSKKLRKNVNRAMNLLNDYQQDKYDKVQRKEDLIDKYESRLGEYLIQLTKREMNTVQTTQVSLYLHTINDFERIGDHASYIAHMANEMHDNHTQFSQAAWDELNIVMEAVREEINVTCNAFMKDDKEAAQRVAPLGAVITNLCDELKMHHVERLSKGECGLEEGTVFNDILNSFGRIAAHSASAMTALLKSGDTDADPHIHDSKIYPTDSWEYYTYFNEYRQKYDVIANAEHVLSMEPEEVE